MPGQEPDNEPDDESEVSVDAFAIAVDDELLAAALAALESRSAPSRSMAAEAPSPPSADMAAADMAAFEADLEVSDDDDVDLGGDEADVVMGDTSWPGPETEEMGPDPDLPDAHASLDFGLLTEEWTRLQEDLTLALDKARELEERLRSETQERRRLAGTVRRMSLQVERAESGLNRAEHARSTLQEQANRLKEAFDRTERDLAHSKARRRIEREEGQRFGHQRALEELIPVLDHLELAATHADADPQRIAEGVDMIVGQFRAALARLGVRRIVANTGAPFEPTVHEAMMQVPAEDAPPGTIARELSAGYLLHERLLRPARVAVAEERAAPPVAPPLEAASDPDAPGPGAPDEEQRYPASPVTDTERQAADPSEPPADA